MKRRFRRKLDRFLIRILANRRSPVEAIRDVDYVREILRFSLLFSTLVLLPVALLALLALRSLETEELSVDAGLSTRAEAIASGVQRKLDDTFEEFESEVRRRIDQGDTNLITLYEIVPGLRGIFRFDADGSLVSPFQLRGPEDFRPAPNPRFERLTRAAVLLEREEDLPAAAQAWLDAREVATHSALEAEAAFGFARVLERQGDKGALDAYVVTAATFPDARDRQGFRIPDLCTLRRVTLLRERGDNLEADSLLKALIERSIAAPWIIGLPGEAFAAREALSRLQGRVDERWHRFATAELGERARLLFWASEVEHELQLVASRPHREASFQQHPEERALWVTLSWNDSLWAFSFVYDGLQRHLSRSVIDIANRADPDLTAALIRTGEEVGTFLARRSLAPRLPLSEVVILATDPEALDQQRQSTRMQRRLVIFLAVAGALFGIIAAVRVVNRQLDAARAKADFAANVSHELRSPLTQIRLKGESLQLDLVYDEADRRAHYDAIVREAERLSRLVDNVLDFAAIERGSKSYTLRPEDLGEILYKAIEAAGSSGASQRARLTADIPDHLPVAWLDREAISQVATNLISNAFKYGDGGSVDIVARPTEDGVEFSVTDHGIGIASDDQDRVFEHFFRVQSADVRKRRGTGIGLTIVRYIVQAHGGTISVESKLGRGSTFTVSFPSGPPPEAGG